MHVLKYLLVQVVEYLLIQALKQLLVNVMEYILAHVLEYLHTRAPCIYWCTCYRESSSLQYWCMCAICMCK